MARPKKNNERKCDTYMKVRMTRDEKMELDMFAKNKGMNKSELILTALKAYYELEEKANSDFDDYYDDVDEEEDDDFYDDYY